MSDLSALLTRRFGPVHSAVPGEGEAKQAAVAVVLRPGEGHSEGAPISESEMLVIKRAQAEWDPWSGHMAFPGGRLDVADADLVQTAVRETMEETDVLLSEASLVGRLEAVHPAGPGLPRLGIWPFVFQVSRDTQGVPDPREVEELHWFSVADMLAESNHGTFHLKHRGKERAFPCVRLHGRVVWGLTYRILTQFLDVGTGRSAPGNRV